MTAGMIKRNKTVFLVKVDNAVYRNVPPLGLLYLGSSLRKAGFDPRIFHITGNEIDEVGRLVSEEKPLFVGFSVVTGWGIKPAAKLSRLIKQKTDVPVVWGNVHPSQLPEQCLNEDYIDIVCIGEGEETVTELAQALESGSDLNHVQGIGFKDSEGNIIINERRPFIADLDRYEIDWGLVDLERYVTPEWKVKRTLRLTASRGCPYRCTFCYNKSFNKSRHRRHSADYVISHLKYLNEKKNIAGFYFNDDNFFVNKEWAWSILESRRCNYYVNCRTEYIDNEFASRLAAAGCREILLGYESGSDRVMKNLLKKGAMPRNNIDATYLLSRHPRIRIIGSFIVGLPGETGHDRQDSLRMIGDILKMHPNIQLIIAFFRPFPGCELYDEAVKRDFRPPEKTEDWFAYDSLSNVHYLPWLDKEESRHLEALCRSADILAALDRFNIPIARQIVRKMMIDGRYDNNFLRLLNKIRTRYAFDESDRTGTLVIRKTFDWLKKVKNLN